MLVSQDKNIRTKPSDISTQSQKYRYDLQIFRIPHVIINPEKFEKPNLSPSIVALLKICALKGKRRKELEGRFERKEDRKGKKGELKDGKEAEPEG